MKSIFNCVSFMLALTVVLAGITVAAQTPATTTQPAAQQQQQPGQTPAAATGGNTGAGQQRRAGGGGGGGGAGRMTAENFGIMRHVSKLTLTDEQKAKTMAIATKYFESTQTQREEIAKLQRDKKAGTASADVDDKLKALRQEMNKSNAAMRKEIEPILTAEQRTQLETMMKEDQMKQKAARTGSAQ